MAALSKRLKAINKDTSQLRANRRAITGRGKQRFGAGETVDAATAERTAMRLKRLTGERPHGINVSDGVTGREARLARDAVQDEKAGPLRTAMRRRESGTQAPRPTTPAVMIGPKRSWQRWRNRRDRIRV